MSLQTITGACIVAFSSPSPIAPLPPDQTEPSPPDQGGVLTQLDSSGEPTQADSSDAITQADSGGALTQSDANPDGTVNTSQADGIVPVGFNEASYISPFPADGGLPVVGAGLAAAVAPLGHTDTKNVITRDTADSDAHASPLGIAIGLPLHS